MPVLAVVAWHHLLRPSRPVNGHVICRRRWYCSCAGCISPSLWAITHGQGQGYYADAGLDVEIRPGGKGISPVQEVLAGRADFGVGNTEVLTHYAQGKPLLALASVYQHSPSIFLARRDSGISHRCGHAWQTDHDVSGSSGCRTAGHPLLSGASRAPAHPGPHFGQHRRSDRRPDRHLQRLSEQ